MPEYRTHMRPALHPITRLYALEQRAKSAVSIGEEKAGIATARITAVHKLHQYLLDLQPEVLPKSRPVSQCVMRWTNGRR